MANRKYRINKDHELYYNVLEEIRKSGICNMWGATEPLMDECPELEIWEAIEILLEWIENYDELSKMYGWRQR